MGKGPHRAALCGPVSELEALSAVIGRLSVEAIEKEALKVRYVTDLVQAQENTRKQLAGNFMTARFNLPLRRSNAFNWRRKRREGA
jgi:hypothetical protein